MDDKDREMLGGGALGGALGFVLGGPPGAAAGSVVGGALAGQEPRHDAVLRRAFHVARRATDGGARLYVDGIDPNGASRLAPAEVLEGVDADPDMVVVDTDAATLVVAVETLAGIERDPEAVLDGLSDLDVAGFERALVVPDGSVEAAGEWARDEHAAGALAAPLTIVAPAGLGDELRE